MVYRWFGRKTLRPLVDLITAEMLRLKCFDSLHGLEAVTQLYASVKRGAGEGRGLLSVHSVLCRKLVARPTNIPQTRILSGWFLWSGWLVT